MTDLRQIHYRYRTDANAADAAPTWGAGEDSSFSPGSANFRLRMALRNAAGTATGSIPWQLYASKNGGSYAAVTTSSTSGVKSVDAGSSADDTAILIPRLYPFSSDWQLSGAAIDMDFAGSRIYPSGSALTDYLSCSRASIGYAKTASGALTQFGTDTLRITDLGLLVEDARINTVVHSSDAAAQTYFQNLTIGTNTTAPDGTATGQKLEEDSATAEHRIGDGSTLNTTGTVLTASVYLKAAQRTWAKLRLTDNATGEIFCWIDLSSGATTSSGVVGSWTNVSVGSETLSNGWYRAFVTGTIGVNSAVTGVLLNLSPDGSSINYAGTVGSGIYAWGLQLEIGSFPSSYIPTTTTSATRAADAIGIIGTLDTVMSSLPNSIVLDIKQDFNSSSDNSGRIITADDVGKILARTLYTQFRSDDLIPDIGNSLTSPIGYKAGIAQNTGDHAAVAGGGTVVSDVTPVGGTTFLMGTGDGLNLRGYIRRFTAWSSRLADATLQGFTAP